MPMPTRMPHEVSLEEVASRFIMNQKPGCNKDFAFKFMAVFRYFNLLRNGLGNKVTEAALGRKMRR